MCAQSCVEVDTKHTDTNSGRTVPGVGRTRKKIKSWEQKLDDLEGEGKNEVRFNGLLVG